MADLIADARKAMLQRLADDLNVLAHADEMEWTCCFQDFDHVLDGRTYRWSWRFCNGGVPGESFATQPCGHWHHQHGPLLIALG